MDDTSQPFRIAPCRSFSGQAVQSESKFKRRELLAQFGLFAGAAMLPTELMAQEAFALVNRKLASGLAKDTMEQRTNTMKSRLELYEHYITAWSAMDFDERMAILSRTVADDVVYRDAMFEGSGAAALCEHLTTFQQRSPGSSFRLLSMLSWDADALANWQIVDRGGKPGFSGYDALTFAEDGRIASIVGFSATDKQRLK